MERHEVSQKSLGTRGYADIRAKALADVVRRIRQSGVTSYRRIADRLNAEQVPTPRGGRWSKTSVARLMTRLHGLQVRL